MGYAMVTYFCTIAGWGGSSQAGDFFMAMDRARRESSIARSKLPLPVSVSVYFSTADRAENRLFVGMRHGGLGRRALCTEWVGPTAVPRLTSILGSCGPSEYPVVGRNDALGGGM